MTTRNDPNSSVRESPLGNDHPEPSHLDDDGKVVSINVATGEETTATAKDR